MLGFYLFLHCLDTYTAIYMEKKSLQKGKEEEKYLGKTVFIFQYKTVFLSLVAGCSAPQVSWVCADKTLNFCVFSFVLVTDTRHFKASLTSVVLLGWGVCFMVTEDMDEAAGQRRRQHLLSKRGTSTSGHPSSASQSRLVPRLSSWCPAVGVWMYRNGWQCVPCSRVAAQVSVGGFGEDVMWPFQVLFIPLSLRTPLMADVSSFRMVPFLFCPCASQAGPE